MIAGEPRAPIIENLDEPPLGDGLRANVLRQVGQAVAVQRRGQDLGDAVEGELSVDANPDLLAVFCELPGVEAAVSRQAQVDAGVMRSDPAASQARARVSKHDGAATTIMRASGADADRDHVLLHLLAEAHAGVETLRDDIGQGGFAFSSTLMSG